MSWSRACCLSESRSSLPGVGAAGVVGSGAEGAGVSATSDVGAVVELDSSDSGLSSAGALLPKSGTEGALVSLGGAVLKSSEVVGKLVAAVLSSVAGAVTCPPGICVVSS